jgi:hypothetical protein
MSLRVREPAEFARQVEEHPQLPLAACERVSGYGVMGLPFRSGHVLGLRRWTASSVGEGYTSIWHRDPAGRWTFYQSAPAEIACTRYFGAGVERVQAGPIAVDWEGDRRLHVHTVDSPAVDWRIKLGSSPVTRLMSLIGSALPMAAWRSRPVLSTMGRVAGQSLRVGTVKLSGTTSNGQPFDANPLRIWLVTDSHAVVEGHELGPTGPLAEQAHLADFYIPQRGIFAIGRFFATRVHGEVPAALPTTEVPK